MWPFLNPDTRIRHLEAVIQAQSLLIYQLQVALAQYTAGTMPPPLPLPQPSSPPSPSSSWEVWRKLRDPTKSQRSSRSSVRGADSVSVNSPQSRREEEVRVELAQALGSRLPEYMQHPRAIPEDQVPPGKDPVGGFSPATSDEPPNPTSA